MAIQFALLDGMYMYVYALNQFLLYRLFINLFFFVTRRYPWCDHRSDFSY